MRVLDEVACYILIYGKESIYFVPHYRTRILQDLINENIDKIKEKMDKLFFGD